MEVSPSTIKGVQEKLQGLGLYSGEIDGIAGEKTWAGISTALTRVYAAIPAPVAPPPSPGGTTSTGYIFDPRSESNLLTLEPATQKVAREFLRQLLDFGMHAKIISGTRTFEEQNALYEQGRTKPGKIVTNARGGYSNHNFAIAFDIGLFDDDGNYLEESPKYSHAAVIGKKLGLSWGGDWVSIQDEPHYELRPDWAEGMSESAMLAKLREQHPELAA